MTAQPLPPVPRRPLTVAEYAELPEDTDGRRYELQEGVLVMSARPLPDHQDAVFELGMQLRPQVPRHLKLLLDVDLDLQLAPPGRPATVRAPDLVVVTRAEFLRVRRQRGFLRACETALTVEVISVGSQRTDSVIKHGEYADAGIGRYWIVDLFGGPRLTACHLAGPFGYANDAPAQGIFATDAPFPVRVDLDALQ